MDLARKTGLDHPPHLVMSNPTASLMYDLLLQNRHNMLVRHLPGLDLEISISQGSLITTHIGKVVVDLIHYQEEKARLRYQMEGGGVLYFY